MQHIPGRLRARTVERLPEPTMRTEASGRTAKEFGCDASHVSRVECGGTPSRRDRVQLPTRLRCCLQLVRALRALSYSGERVVAPLPAHLGLARPVTPQFVRHFDGRDLLRSSSETHT